MRRQMLGAFGVGFATGMLTLAMLMWHSAGGKTQASATSHPSDAQPPVPFKLGMPIAGVDPKNLTDTFKEGRQGHTHEALDIPAARGTAVLAVGDGRVVKLFTSKQGGLTVYQFDPTEQFCYYYAHLDGYAPGLREGMQLRMGDVLGYVGTTGNAPPHAPHLHLAVFRLGPEKKWWEGTAIDPLPLLR
jgi:murein DD-endopeptidase MepM/ murein hydrolase activator NlpD